MSGREKIERFSYLIHSLEFISKFIPRLIFNSILSVFNNTEASHALLLRYLYVRKYAKKCGTNIFIGKGVIIKNIENLALGSNISVHAYSYIDAAGKISIGNEVSIANHTSLISFEHTWTDTQLPIKYNKVEKGNIEILNDVWIGCGCRVLSNVSIGSRSIIAAGAVVNQDVKSNTIVGGVPARKIKDI